jgi:ribosomal protein RSM22 (predicted rRNA methylase)
VCCAQIKLRRPEWTPKSLMDFGSGPGTAVWSATEVWPELDNILAVEPSEAMIDVANELCKGTTTSSSALSLSSSSNVCVSCRVCVCVCVCGVDR